MYAILVEDAIAEDASILSTLAADSMSAMILMLTTGESWIAAQAVDLGYTLCQHDKTHSVTVVAGPSVVLTITVQEITAVMGAMELTAFTHPNGSKH